MNKNITLLSLYASSSRYDFFILKDELQKNDSGCSVHYFLGNREAKEKNQVRSMLYEAGALKDYDSDWVGIEGFLPEEFVIEGSKTKRYLLLEPFDILFRMKWNRKNCQQFLQGYTHVVVPSSYWADKIRSCIGESEIQILRDVQLPFFEKAADQTYQQVSRAQLEERYTDLIGKKIMYINLTGQRANPERNDYTEMNMKALLDILPEDWIIVTNSLNLRFASRYLDAVYRDKFIYLSAGTMKKQLLTCADCLMSNNAYSSALFASMGRPYAIVQFSDNSFEKYMHKRSRHQMITNKENMAETVRLMINGKYPSRMVEELDMTADKSLVQEILDI